VESQFGDAEVSSLETGVRSRTIITFDPTVGSPLKVYRSFWNPLFERAITFDPTVGSLSNFYRSFCTPLIYE